MSNSGYLDHVSTLPELKHDIALAEKRGDIPKGYLTDAHLDSLEEWLESKFKLPIVGPVGLDGIVGLIPGVGDVMTTGVSAVFVADAIKIGASKGTIARMAGNVALDFAVGAIPLVGDIFDFAFKSNRKNLRLLRKEKARLAGLHTSGKSDESGGQ